MRKNRVALFSLAVLAVFSFAVLLYAGEGKEAKTISGTLVDLKCYAAGGFLTNDHGDMENCGTMCAKGGLPVAIVDKDKKVHVLGVPAPAYANYVGLEVRLQGKTAKHADVFIPSTLEIKENGKWVEKKLPKTMM